MLRSPLLRSSILALAASMAAAGAVAEESAAPRPAKIKKEAVSRKSKAKSPAKAKAPAAPAKDEVVSEPEVKPTEAPVTAEPVTAPTTAPEVEAKPLPVVDTQVSTKEPEERYVGYGKTHGFLGDFPIGPTVSILQIPHPLQVGIEGKYLDIAGFSGMYGVVPKITIKDASIKLDSWDVRARWFPFRGAFFMGAAYGQQKLTGTKSQVISVNSISTPVEAKDEINTTYLSPHLGWRWVTNVGFFYGMELGWQFAMKSNATLTTNQEATILNSGDATAISEYNKLKSDIEKTSNDIGKVGLPHLTLIQIGWYF